MLGALRPHGLERLVLRRVQQALEVLVQHVLVLVDEAGDVVAHIAGIMPGAEESVGGTVVARN